jgi:hypothetical protein
LCRYGVLANNAELFRKFYDAAVATVGLCTLESS